MNEDRPSLTYLAELARKGNDGAEEELFRRLHVRFSLFAAQRVGDSQDAADIAQEACLTVARKHKGEEFEVSFEAWAWGVFQMTIRNYFSRTSRQRQRQVSVDANRISEQSSSPEVDPVLQRRLVDCLREVLKVNPRFARVLNLVYQGYKAPEISRRMGIKPNHLYVLLHRARKLLRECLEQGNLP